MLIPTLSMLVALGGGPATPAAPAVAQDTVYRIGQFNTIDRLHWANGRVAIFRTDEGALVLAFAEEFSAADGPDLYVVLSSDPEPRNSSDLGDYIELRELDELSGAQVFILPESLDPTTVGSVVIYCKRFEVIFSVAMLSSPGG